MKMKRKIITLCLTAILATLPMTAMAAENTSQKIYSVPPTVEMVQNAENETYSVVAKNESGEIVFAEDGIKGSVLEVSDYVYGKLFEAAVYACSHIPCNNSKVWGGITHIVGPTICSKVQCQFYKCACCDAILGKVDNSCITVGTHPSSEH